MNNNLKILLTQILLLTATTLMGQQDTLMVGPGETFETIANRYGVTMDELFAANPGKDKCYAGMTIIVPQPQNSPVGDVNISSVVIMRADSLLLSAKDKSKNGLYKKAIKLYNKVIDMGVRTPYAYAGRGECYFNLKNYKKAKKDLRKAIFSGELARIEKDWCESALEDVEGEIQAKRERRSEIWSNIGLTFASALALVGTAYVASEQAKAQNQYYQSSISSSPGNSSSYSTRTKEIIAQSDANINRIMANGYAQLNMINQQTMMNIQATQARRHQSIREEIEWKSEFNKKNGRYPTEYETDQWYSVHYPDFLEIRILARAKMASSDTGDEDNYSGNTSELNNNDTSQKTRHDCPGCNGKGRIERNDGSVPTYGNRYKKKCPICGYEYWNSTFHRHEECRICHGKGYREY